MVSAQAHPITLNQPVNVMCESYRITEQIDDRTGQINAVYLEGVAITFGKPTRNRVSYAYQSGMGAHKTLIGKPFLDTHNDTSIRTHPPFGHVAECSAGTNPRNQLPCLFYKVDLDPDEKVFIRKAKRGDIPGVSIQVLVDDVQDAEDEYGTYMEANIREYLELSAVLIPGDGDTSVALAESFKKAKEKVYKEINTTNGEGVIGPDGVFPTRKVRALEQEDEEEIKPLMPLDEPLSKQSIIYGRPDDEIDAKVDKPLKLIGKRKTEVAFRGCMCPACGMQMLKDSYVNGMELRCWACDYRITKA
jgi:hypothetical protein